MFHTCGLYPRMASNYMCFPQNQRKASELENKKRKCTDWQRDAAIIKIRENRRRKKKKKKEIIETRKIKTRPASELWNEKKNAVIVREMQPQ